MSTPIEIVINGKDNTTGAFKSAGGGLASVGNIAMGILTSQVFMKLAQGVVDFGKSVVSEARESELVMAGLEQTLLTMGGVSGMTAESISALSTAISENSKYTDEAITEAAGLMLTFDKIGKDTFPRAQQMAVDMAAKFKMDLGSATIGLSKALQGTAGSLSALSKQGITFTGEQKKVIQALFDTGHAAEAQAMIMDAVGPQVDGFAETQVTAFEKVTKKIDNMKESLGTALLPAIDKAGEAMSKALDNPRVQAALENIAVALGDGLSKAVDSAVIGFDALSKSGDKVRAFITPFVPAIKSIMNTFELLRPTLEKVAETLGGKLAEAGRQLSDNVFPFLVESLDKFSAWFAENRPLIEAYATLLGERFAFIVEAVVNFWAVVEPLLSGFIELILELVELTMELATGDWSAAWETMGDIVETIFSSIGEAIVAALNWIAGLMGGSLQSIKSQWVSNWEQLKSITAKVWDIIKVTISTKLNEIKAAVTAAWSTITAGVNSFVSSIKATITSAFNSIASTILAKLNSIKSSFTSAFSNMVSTASSAMANMRGVFSAALAGIIGGVMSWGGSLITQIKAAIVNAIAAAKEAIAAFITIGGDIMENIINGLKGNLGALINYIKTIMKSIVSNILKKTSVSADISVNNKTTAPDPGGTSRDGRGAVAGGSTNNRVVNNYYNPHIVVYAGSESKSKSVLKGIL